jgi:GNAT superfamily N-acetyltransferase
VDRDDTVIQSLEDITTKYCHPTHCDPYQDVLIAEVNDQIIAYARVTWWQIEGTGERIYFMAWYIRPEWRGKGLEETFLCRSQERIRQIIRQQDSDGYFGGARLYEAHAMDFQPDQARLLGAYGFQAVRWGSIMTCSDLQNIPDVPVPVGLEVQPAKPEHYRAVWEALLDAFQDDPGYTPPTEDDYARWQQGSQFQPALWKIAWDPAFANGAGAVAGMALNAITREPGGDERGTAWTEDICVRPHWRRRGLARALLASSMRMFRTMGFSQTSLGVDLNNPHGARQLYESMGYQLISVLTIYHKPVDL